MATISSVDSPPAAGTAYQRVAVTGATGFLGGRLVDFLRELGANVTCLCRPESRREKLEQRGFATRVVNLHSVDAWREALQDTDLVFHLAAMLSSTEREAILRANTLIPAALGQAASTMETPPTIVYCSSIAAAGPVDRNRVRYAGMPATPVSWYGKSKRGGELALARYADRVPITIVRPGIIFGPTNRELMAIYKSIAWTRMHFVPGFRSPRLSLVYVDDVCQILWRAAVRGKRIRSARDGDPPLPDDRGVYFAVAPEHIDYAELGRAVAQALNVWHARIHVPQPLPWILAGALELIWRANPGEPPPFTIDKLREATAGSWACSDPRLESELGFRPPCSLQQRLNETLQWYRDEGWL